MRHEVLKNLKRIESDLNAGLINGKDLLCNNSLSRKKLLMFLPPCSLSSILSNPDTYRVF